MQSTDIDRCYLRCKLCTSHSDTMLHVFKWRLRPTSGVLKSTLHGGHSDSCAAAVERLVFVTHLHTTRHTASPSDSSQKPSLACIASPCMKPMHPTPPGPMANISPADSSCSHSSAPVDTLMCSSQVAGTASSASSGATGDTQRTAQHSVAHRVMQKEMGALRADREQLLQSMRLLKASVARQVRLACTAVLYVRLWVVLLCLGLPKVPLYHRSPDR